MTNQKSKCCNADLMTSFGVEGTGCYVCLECMKPCDSRPHKRNVQKLHNGLNKPKGRPAFHLDDKLKEAGRIAAKAFREEQAILEDWQKAIFSTNRNKKHVLVVEAYLAGKLIEASKQESYKQGCEEQRKKDMALNDSCKKEISRNVMQSSYHFNNRLA